MSASEMLNVSRTTSAASFAHKLAALEAGNDRDDSVATSIRVIETLGLHLSQIIGREGFRSLLTRAIKLAILQVPSVADVKLSANNPLPSLFESPPSEYAGAMAIVNNILDLLINLIGEDLTVRILRSIWPEITIDAADGKESELP